MGAWNLNPGALFDKAPHAEQSDCCLIAVVKQSYNLGFKTDDILYIGSFLMAINHNICHILHQCIYGYMLETCIACIRNYLIPCYCLVDYF